VTPEPDPGERRAGTHGETCERMRAPLRNDGSRESANGAKVWVKLGLPPSADLSTVARSAKEEASAQDSRRGAKVRAGGGADNAPCSRPLSIKYCVPLFNHLSPQSSGTPSIVQ